MCHSLSEYESVVKALFCDLESSFRRLDGRIEHNFAKFGVELRALQPHGPVHAKVVAQSTDSGSMGLRMSKVCTDLRPVDEAAPLPTVAKIASPDRAMSPETCLSGDGRPAVMSTRTTERRVSVLPQTGGGGDNIRASVMGRIPQRRYSEEDREIRTEMLEHANAKVIEAMMNRTSSASASAGAGYLSLMVEYSAWLVKANSLLFEGFFGAILLMNIIYIGAQVQLKALTLKDDSSNKAYIACDFLFMILFMIELCLRMLACGLKHFFTSNDWNWNTLDLVTVLFSMLDNFASFLMRRITGSGTLRVVRIVRFIRVIRVLRIIRAMRFFRTLRILIGAILNTMKTFIWMVMLLFMVLYIAGIVCTQISSEYIIDQMELGVVFEDNDPLFVFYGRLNWSMLTLFMCVTGGLDWNDPLTPLRKIHTMAMLFFTAYISFVSLAVLNVVTGLFCQSALEVAQNDHQNAVQQQLDDKMKYVQTLKAMFKQWDTIQEGEISLLEFEHNLKDENMRNFLQVLEIEFDDAWSLFRMLDKDGGGSVDATEFVDGCLRLKGVAKCMKLEQLTYEHKWFANSMSSWMNHIYEVVDEIFLLLTGGEATSAADAVTPLRSPPSCGTPESLCS
jgi:hypothetical protein